MADSMVKSPASQDAGFLHFRVDGKEILASA
jgi:hypothetical protein